MKWYLIELTRGDEYETELKASTREEALAEAKLHWSKLSEHDKKDTSDFFAVYTTTDEDGAVDLDAADETIKFAEIKRPSTVEVINSWYNRIAQAMIERYRSVLECYGRIQYSIYIWEDGELEVLQDVQGGNTRLAPRDAESRALYYVTDVKQPGFDPWACADEPKPEDEAEAAEKEKEIIDWCVEEYEMNIDDTMDEIIREHRWSD